MSTEKKKVLVMADWFAPGFKAGGPIRSCVNFAEHLKNDLDIYVLTSDRDLNDANPYQNILQDKWIETGSGFKIFYASPRWLSFFSIKEAINQVRPDVVYLNSMFSKFFSFYPLLIKKYFGSGARYILAPRGMLRASAVQFKSGKKKIFLNMFRLAGLQKKVEFHCTDETEFTDVKRYFGAVPAVVLPNLPGFQKKLVLPENKFGGRLKLLFVGRAHPIKNLDLLLKILKDVKSSIELTIVAAKEDKDYWEECENLISELPNTVRVSVKGELPHQEIESLLLSHHVFVLPTKGENFGHAIFEALAAGRPVVISDQTPWRNLSQYKAGWELSLDKPNAFADAIERFAAMEHEEFNEWCVGAWQFVHSYIEHSDNKKKYLEFFNGTRMVRNKQIELKSIY